MAVRAGLVFVVYVAAYWTAVGGGFLSDDFRWILESRVRSAGDLSRLFVDTTGFYRPVVALGFAAIEQIAGNDPRPYGIALFLIAALCAAAVATLARALGLPAGAALAAGSLWLLNPHGINMAILWISGLTALSLVLFTTASAIAVARGWVIPAVLLFFAALLSKEEAVLMPVPLLLIALVRRPALSRAAIAALAGGFAIAEAAYFWLRAGSDAMTASTAPSFYRFTFHPGDIAANALQYADRSLTLSVGAALLALLVVRARPAMDDGERRAILIGAVWLVVAYGVTIFLPVRSSLYALLPAVGGAVAAGALLSALWRVATERQRMILATAAVVVPIALLPVLRSRTDRWTDLMRVTRMTIEAVAPAVGAERAVVFVDDRARRDNLENGFRALLPDAIELYSGRRPDVWMVPSPSDATADQIERVPEGVILGFRYGNGRVERIDGRALAGSDALRMR